MNADVSVLLAVVRSTDGPFGKDGLVNENQWQSFSKYLADLLLTPLGLTDVLLECLLAGGLVDPDSFFRDSIVSIHFGNFGRVRPAIWELPMEELCSLSKGLARPQFQSLLCGQELYVVFGQSEPFALLLVFTDTESHGLIGTHVSLVDLFLNFWLHMLTTLLYLSLRPLAMFAYELKAGYGFLGKRVLYLSRRTAAVISL